MSGVAGKGQREDEKAGAGNQRGQEVDRVLLASSFLSPKPRGPSLLPTSCHRAEVGLLYIIRGTAASSHMVRRPLAGAPWKMASMDPSSGPAPSSPGVLPQAQGPPWLSLLDAEALYMFPILSLFTHWLKEGREA